MKNWKTNIVGFTLIVAGIYVFLNTKDFTQPLICLTMGTGFFFAKDNNKKSN